jgi:hypothetical protein
VTDLRTVPRPAAPTRPPRRRAGRRLRRAGRVAGGGLAVLVISLVTVLVASTVWWRADPPVTVRSRGVNALWLRHAWVGEPHTQAEYAALGAMLRRGDISDALFHAGPLAPDGTVRPARYANASELLRALDRVAPGVRPQAYLGQVERRGGGPLDVTDPAVRAAVVGTARALLDLGFGGIHYDIEPVVSGDPHFLELLDETHALTRSRGAVLSVALEEVAPAGPWLQLARAVPNVPEPSLLRPAYLSAIADRVDQVAIMTYGIFLPTEALFGRYMASQTEQVAGIVGDRATVFMGVPSEDHPRRPAESVRSGVRGARRGLAALGPGHTGDVGLALFAEWTTTEAEWAEWERGWVHPR